MKCSVVGEAYTFTLCTLLRISYMHVQIFMWEGTEHSVFHIHGLQPRTRPVTTVRWCHCLALCSCVPSWCSELQQFQRFAMGITFAANHHWSHNTERTESSAGTERVLKNEQGGTVGAARRTAATRQIPGTEHLWTARQRSDVRAMRTGLLQPNAASVCYWQTIHCYVIVVFSCLNLNGCFV